MKKIIPLIALILFACGSTSGRVDNETTRTNEPEAYVPSGSAKISYHLALANPANHDIRVSILVEDHDDSVVEFVMPTWAPERLVRDDFAAKVSEVSARGRGAKTLRISRTASNHWRVAAGGEDLVFSYTVHAGRLSNGTSLLDDQGATIHPAGVCMFVEGRRDQPHNVYLDVPDSLQWSSFAAIPAGDGANRFIAPSYGDLVRTPIHVGKFSEHLINFGNNEARVLVTPANSRLSAQVANGAKELLTKTIEIFGDSTNMRDLVLSYRFGVGASHAAAMSGPKSVLVASSERISERSVRQALDATAAQLPRIRAGKSLEVVAWNRVDFDGLLVNRGTWIPRAVGEYFGLHLLHRSGLISRFELLNRFSGIINRIESAPAKRILSLAQASENESLVQTMGFAPTNQRNQHFNIFDRGVGTLLLLDLSVIASTEGDRDLSAVFKTFDARRRVLSEQDFFAMLQETGGRKLRGLADQLTTTTDLRPWADTAREAGFVIRAGSGGRSQLGTSLDGTRVKSVDRGGAAARAGLQVGDRIVRFAGVKATKSLKERIASFPAGTDTTVTVERRGTLVTLPIRMGAIRRGGFQMTEGDQSLKSYRMTFFGEKQTP